MPITAEDVNAAIQAYATAMDAADYDAAMDQLLKAKGLIVGLPDMSGQDGASFKYGREGGVVHLENPTGLFCQEAQRPLPPVVEKLLVHLYDRERRILEWRFGLCGHRKLKLKQIARKLGCCTATVRRRVNTALEKATAYYVPE